jgi:hypothetical protein
MACGHPPHRLAAFAGLREVTAPIAYVPAIPPNSPSASWTSPRARSRTGCRPRHMPRFTRLTNAFSKKVENHAHSMALFSTYYNFVRIHKTLRVTPAMAAGATEKLWEIGDIVGVLEAWEASN